MHRKHTTTANSTQSASSVSHSEKPLRRYLSFRPVAVLAAAFAAMLTTGLAAGSFCGAAGAAATPHATSHALASSGLGYTSLAAPVRIADTRTVANGGTAGSYNGDTLAAGGHLTIDVPSADIPTTASAVVFKLTAI